ncbi:Na+/H+ antiporter subunit B [Neorhizobium lilium]|uniref:Na+/H+ antiporter subunit B n=1 Tax=Neorhizobium lilium TaxID=2503024 RepID=A0A3S3SBF7_9HYPH|nr:Na+/H+ antiporter subunit B [Neorhizobium lilium]
MNTLILRTVAPALTALMLLFSVFVLLRGHNEPGGGFIGGLIAASALAIYGIAFGVGAVRRALRFHPMAIAGAGLFLATLSGLLSILFGVPFMTGLWVYPRILGLEVPLATVISFDLGVYLVVLGSIVSIALALEQDSETEIPDAEVAQAPPLEQVPLRGKRRRRDRQPRETR